MIPQSGANPTQGLARKYIEGSLAEESSAVVPDISRAPHPARASLRLWLTGRRTFDGLLIVTRSANALLARSARAWRTTEEREEP
jgi:hypothetical protein